MNNSQENTCFVGHNKSGPPAGEAPSFSFEELNVHPNPEAEFEL